MGTLELFWQFWNTEKLWYIYILNDIVDGLFEYNDFLKRKKKLEADLIIF